MPPKVKPLALVAVAAVSALALAGCSSTSSSPAATDDNSFSLVTSTNVYGDIAQQIAGDGVTVTPIIASAAQDPHEYEATAGDQLTVQSADLIVSNGGGYDSFIDTMIDASGSTAPVIVAAEYSHSWPGEEADEHTTDSLEDDPHAEEEHDHDHIEGFNEHVWYDPHTIEHVAEAIAQELSTQLPDQADTFAANLAAFESQIAELETSLDEIKSAHEGESVFYTEPVPGYLVAAAGLENATPDAFSEAVEEGQDVPPATLLEAKTAIESGDVKVLIANAQTGGAETTQVIDVANAQGIPVLEFTETLPDGETYIQWMQENVAALAGALDK
ncbi:zinc/manganese transport system substrate-binding protein [Microbacterium endophyticum]|uniref:Zinc/manganese transport system substrate-binding protein n=1 Tax=Microbacterium endophyticum TaxID=1526412 RepID=A0A7W4V420_9MICO|nr:zinc ABC transporter substrate-binding protein [Microbacterium endophyticum]MBB2976461.1 zinc/manganese transport system substrate-binding protein [Microbacterium endophyticum]NIK35907.1 zinc/manganese transport system substrate-binding protein [Microbacterium endophyticum]